MLDDRQSEAGAAGGTVAGRVDAIEAFEDPVDLLGRDADALVGDRDLDDGVESLGADDDGGAVGGVLHGIGDQVRQRERDLFLVAEHDQDRALFRFFHIARLGGERLVPQSAKIKIKARPARAIECEKLGLRSKDAVFEITRLRLIDGKPAIRESIILPGRLFPRLDRIGDLPNTLYSLYQSQFGITVAAAREELRAAMATREDQSSLGLKAGTPILVISRVALSLTGEPVEWRESRVRTDQLVYAVTLQ